MKAVMKFFIKYLDWLTDISSYLSGILIIAAIVIVNGEVVLRYVFSYPTEWGIPLAEYVLCYLALLPFAWILKSEGHVKVDFFISRLSFKKRALVKKMLSFICMLLWAAMFIVSCVTTWQGYWRHEYLGGEFRAPQFLMTLPVAITSFLLTCQFARRWRAPSGEFVSREP